MYSQQADSAYKRLTHTVDLTGKTSGELKFKMSYDTEAGFDYVFVEAHSVGQEDWTTLPDKNGNTSQDTGVGCPDDDPFWLQENPFLTHYITRSGSTGAFECAPTGTSGSWNAATGNSAGFHDWDIDLTAYAGKQVEVSITYASDPGSQGLGVFVDDTAILADGASVESTSFEADTGGWTVPGAPADSGPNSNDWIRTCVRRLRRRPGRGHRPLGLLGLRPRGRGRPHHAGPAHQGRDDAVRGERLARWSRDHLGARRGRPRGRPRHPYGARSLTPWGAP